MTGVGDAADDRDGGAGDDGGAGSGVSSAVAFATGGRAKSNESDSPDR